MDSKFLCYHNLEFRAFADSFCYVFSESLLYVYGAP